MELKELLARNLAQIMCAKGIDEPALFNKAKAKGYKLHRTTISNLLKAETMFRGESILVMSDVLEVDAALLFWKAGIDENGRPIGVNFAVDQDICDWAVFTIENLLDEIDLDDSEFKSKSISRAITIAHESGKEKAYMDFMKSLKNYAPAS